MIYITWYVRICEDLSEATFVAHIPHTPTQKTSLGEYAYSFRKHWYIFF